MGTATSRHPETFETEDGRCPRTFGQCRKEEKETLRVCVFFYLFAIREVYFELLAIKFIYLITTTTTVSVGVEGHTEVSGPERLVHGRKVKIHASERFNCVVIRFDSQVSHFA